MKYIVIIVIINNITFYNYKIKIMVYAHTAHNRTVYASPPVGGRKQPER
jgi:hypothetical protein